MLGQQQVPDFFSNVSHNHVIFCYQCSSRFYKCIRISHCKARVHWCKQKAGKPCHLVCLLLPMMQCDILQLIYSTEYSFTFSSMSGSVTVKNDRRWPSSICADRTNDRMSVVFLCQWSLFSLQCVGPSSVLSCRAWQILHLSRYARLSCAASHSIVSDPLRTLHG